MADSTKLQTIARVLHVLALGLWVGGGVMFSLIVAPTVFATFDSAQAGNIVAPIFPPYFALQGVCGLVAVGTAAAWANRGRPHRIRFVILMLAVALVLAGWPLVGKVAELRAVRETSEAARADFGRWHGISLSLNLATLMLATAGLALAACLPPLRLADEHDSL